MPILLRIKFQAKVECKSFSQVVLEILGGRLGSYLCEVVFHISSRHERHCTLVAHYSFHPRSLVDLFGMFCYRANNGSLALPQSELSWEHVTFAGSTSSSHERKGMLMQIFTFPPVTFLGISQYRAHPIY